MRQQVTLKTAPCGTPMDRYRLLTAGLAKAIAGARDVVVQRADFDDEDPCIVVHMTDPGIVFTPPAMGKLIVEVEPLGHDL